MKTRELVKIGIPAGRCADAAKQLLRAAHDDRRELATIAADLPRVAASPPAFLDDARYGRLAHLGVDIACRMKMTVLDLPMCALTDDQPRLRRALERETQFGMGAAFRSRRQHEVMDADWRVTSLTATLKDRAWSQLGTSGSGKPLRGIRPSRRDRRCRWSAVRRVRRAAQSASNADAAVFTRAVRRAAP